MHYRVLQVFVIPITVGKVVLESIILRVVENHVFSE